MTQDPASKQHSPPSQQRQQPLPSQRPKQQPQRSSSGRRHPGLKQIKAQNQRHLMRLILEGRARSRAELTALTRLSPTTVSSLTENLIRAGLVRECGATPASGPGRKAIRLEPQADGGFWIGCEIKRDRLQMQLFNLLLENQATCVRSLQADDFPALDGLLTASIRQMLDENHVRVDRLLGIAVGVPAIVDRRSGAIRRSTVLPALPDADFLKRLRGHWPSVSIRIENQSLFCAYAEKDASLQTGLTDLLYLDIDVGIGSGIMLDGRMYRGVDGLAGEIGHICIDRHGEPCACGSRGCLEQLANVPDLLARAAAAIQAGQSPVLSRLCGGDSSKLTLDLMREAARQKDAVTLAAINNLADVLSCGIVSVLNLLNLQAVIIGGEIVHLGDPLLDRINRAVRRSALLQRPRSNTPMVHFGHAGVDAAQTGGARLLLDEWLGSDTGLNGK